MSQSQTDFCVLPFEEDAIICNLSIALVKATYNKFKLSKYCSSNSFKYSFSKPELAAFWDRLTIVLGSSTLSLFIDTHESFEW